MSAFDYLPREIVHYILGFFDYLEIPTLQLVDRTWCQIFNEYLPKKKELFEAELKIHLNDLDYKTLPMKDTYAAYAYLMSLPSRYVCRNFFSMVAKPLFDQPLPVVYVKASLLRHKIKGAHVVLFYGSLIKGAHSLNEQEVALAMRLLADIGFGPHWAYMYDCCRRNIFSLSDKVAQSAIFGFSKLLHVDSAWNLFKDAHIVHKDITPPLIPYYAILVSEMHRAKRIEIIAPFFTVKTFRESYQKWTLWERSHVLRLLRHHIRTVIHSSEYESLVEFLLSIIARMSSHREEVLSSFGEFFAIIDILGHFNATIINNEHVYVQLLHLLARTLVVFQMEYPHMTDVVHGLLVKLHQLILDPQCNNTVACPKFVEYFYIVWCDDNAIKIRKLWFIKRLTCKENVKSVKRELEQLILYEDDERVKVIAQEFVNSLGDIVFN